jgi:hypothetical protein
LLVAKYLRFCTINGLAARNIKKEVKVLAKFGIKLEYKESYTTVAYTNLRWGPKVEETNDSDKKNAKHAEDGKKEGTKEINYIKKFSKMYLLKSTFDSDFIMVSELQERYSQY